MVGKYQGILAKHERNVGVNSLVGDDGVASDSQSPHVSV